MKRLPVPLLIAAFALLVLPPILLALGLTMTSATDVVIFATACMALNILVGHTGLVSFGHGAWFGLGAYAAALLQRTGSPIRFSAAADCRRCRSSWPSAAAFGFLILRRRGVYFSLLTLALAAMLYAIAFRWTDVTGGENGIGGLHAAGAARIQSGILAPITAPVAAIAFAVLISLWRFRRSPSAPCWWRSARTSSAPASWAMPPTATSSRPS